MSFGIGSNNYYSYFYGTGSISSASNSGSANGAGSAGSAAQSSAAQTTNSVTYKPTAYVPQWQRELDAHLGYSGSADATGSASGSGSAWGAGSAGSAGSVGGPSKEEIMQAVEEAAESIVKSLLSYYEEHGTVEGFCHSQLPYGARVIDYFASKYNSDPSNDLIRITNTDERVYDGGGGLGSVAHESDTETEIVYDYISGHVTYVIPCLNDYEGAATLRKDL